MRLADVRWGGVNLAVVPWDTQRISILGDEVEARKTAGKVGKAKSKADHIQEWDAAVRAYRQLAVALRNQGMNEQADIFAYRAQLCQRQVLRLRRRVGGYLWSHFLDLLAGYGYQPIRTILAYVLLILGFALAYMQFGMIDGHALHFDEAVVYSLTSFHGRGFFPGGLKLDDPIVKMAAGEAVAGLLIEISFIATFTQRFFSR